MVELPSFGRNLEAQGPRVLDVANFPPLQAVNQNVPVDSVADGKGPLLDILADGARQWENALLGNFLGKSPPLGVFQKMVDKLWGREGSITICFLAPSVYVLNFPSQKKKGQDQVVDAVSSDLVVEGGEQKVVPENNDDLILDVVEELVVVLESVDQDVVDAISILSGVVQDHDLVLETENVNQFCLLVEDPDCPKKSRAAADGVYVLMNQLKPKGKGGGNKKKGKGGKRGGGSPVAP
ncbi:hypothetical protein V6N11_023498 [Hibiscus sabdariffa]|uniref:DUF4283 domain-containing protein n=1 Tax=Hibiscus sabdariffa TaxID=183260 RepID=A0ABR2TMD7_9ROSI